MNRYELNVAVKVTGHGNYKHFCRVIIPDNLTRNEVVARAKSISIAFKEQMSNGSPDAFQFTLTAWSETGTPLNME